MSAESLGNGGPGGDRGTKLVSGVVRALGKGPGYVALAVFETILGFALALRQPDALDGFALVLGAVNVAVYGGGAVNAFAKNGASTVG